MILTCPQCSSRYHVDPASFSPDGRKVRCANCGHRWLAKPPADMPKAVSLEPAPRPRAPERPRADAQRATTTAHRTQTRPRSLLGWLGGALVVLLLASAIIARNEIVAGFPASASIYQTLGLPVSVELGLEFRGVTSDLQEDGGIQVLVVQGEIVNYSAKGRDVPPIRLAVLDADGRELQFELFDAEQGELEAGATTRFSGRLVSPSEQGKNMQLSFATPS